MLAEILDGSRGGVAGLSRRRHAPDHSRGLPDFRLVLTAQRGFVDPWQLVPRVLEILVSARVVAQRVPVARALDVGIQQRRRTVPRGDGGRDDRVLEFERGPRKLVVETHQTRGQQDQVFPPRDRQRRDLTDGVTLAPPRVRSGAEGEETLGEQGCT